MWLYGLSLYTHQKDKHVRRKILTHPCVIAVFIDMMMALGYNLGIYLPSGISNTLKAIGDCSTTLCLVIIGTIISEMNSKELLNRKALLYNIYRIFLILLFILFYPLINFQKI